MHMIGVVGAGSCSKDIYEQARKIGEGIAKVGATLVCGGLGGVMEGACRGAFEAGGTTVGILPGTDRHQANAYVTIPVVTDLGHARNILVVRSSDIIIAVSGGYGTLSEISIALKVGKPVIGLATWSHMEAVQHVATPKEALVVMASLLTS